MKILLIEPHKAELTIGGEDVFLYEPLALEYLAAGVTGEHETRILDMRIDRNMQAVLDDFRPDIVGITGFTSHVNVVRGLFAKIKAWRPEVLTVVGGHHATVMPEDFLSPDIDLVVMGEGVFAFREIVSRHDGGKSFEGIPGVCFRSGSGLVRAENTELTDLDSVPFPNRKLTAKYRSHYYSEWMKPLASIRTSKGCPHRCSFCAQWKLAKGRYLRRNPHEIVEELRQIEEDFVFFADDESLIDVKRMTELAALIRESGIRKRYFLYGRSDTISRYPELLKLWREIGLERVFVGLEFFRDEDLEYIRKKSTLQDNENAVRILHELGIDVFASFIVRQEFHEADFAELRKYCAKLGLGFASFAVLTPLPGTDLLEETRDRIITHNYDFVDFMHTQLPTALPLKQFYAEFAGLYANGTPLGKRLALLTKFPPLDIPYWLNKGRTFNRRLKSAYLDYEL
jgi:radical SAM superfamily enzyme YgiQ (UPF0313 family)